jgi:hypothetical protein
MQRAGKAGYGAHPSAHSRVKSRHKESNEGLPFHLAAKAVDDLDILIRVPSIVFRLV